MEPLSFQKSESTLKKLLHACPYLLYVIDGILGFFPVTAGKDHPGSLPGEVQSCGLTDAGVASCNTNRVT